MLPGEQERQDGTAGGERAGRGCAEVCNGCRGGAGARGRTQHYAAGSWRFDLNLHRSKACCACRAAGDFELRQGDELPRGAIGQQARDQRGVHGVAGTLGDDGTYVSTREVALTYGIDLDLLQRVQRAIGLARIDDPDAAVHMRADAEAARAPAARPRTSARIAPSPRS